MLSENYSFLAAVSAVSLYASLLCMSSVATLFFFGDCNVDCEHCVWAGHYESSETDGFHHQRETVCWQVRRGSTCAYSTGVNALVWNLFVSNFRCCSTNLLRKKLAIPHLVPCSMQQLNYLLPSTLTESHELSESGKICRFWSACVCRKIGLRWQRKLMTCFWVMLR